MSIYLATPWTVARQAFLSMEFPRQEYWSWLLFPSPGDLPDPGVKSHSPALQADSLPSEQPGKLFLQWIVIEILFKSFKSFTCSPPTPQPRLLGVSSVHE